MRRRLRQLIDWGEEGFSLIWIAMVLTLLLGMAAFGTDLGWLYLNAVRAQNAVDAAVLAGVVNLLIGLYVLVAGAAHMGQGTALLVAFFFLGFAAVDFYFPRAMRKRWLEEQTRLRAAQGQQHRK